MSTNLKSIKKHVKIVRSDIMTGVWIPMPPPMHIYNNSVISFLYKKELSILTFCFNPPKKFL